MTTSSIFLTPISVGLLLLVQLHASLAFSPTLSPTDFPTALSSNSSSADQHDHRQRAVIISVVVIVGAGILALIIAIVYWLFVAVAKSQQHAEFHNLQTTTELVEGSNDANHKILDDVKA